MKKILSIALILLALTCVFVSCSKKEPAPAQTAAQPTEAAPAPVEVVIDYDGYLDFDSYKAYILNDLDAVLASIGTDLDAATMANIQKAYKAGVEGINNGTSVKTVQAAFDSAKAAMANCIPLADGVYSFVSLSNAERTEILGTLEAYCIRNGITGISLFENGNYQMYNPRVTLGTETYITGYGFGTLAEGSLTADLETETNPAWKRYYHTINAADPGTANYLNDQGSETGDFYGYIGASFFTTFMNASKDGYDWVPELAVEKPVAIDPDETGMSTRWRFEIRQDLKYNTLGKYAAEYDGKAVELEDFITPFKLLLNQANGYYRGSELAAATGPASFKGGNAYYEATADARKGILSDAEVDFGMVGIKVYEENGKWYFEYEVGSPVNQFYAMYYIASSLYMPVPASFIEKVGVDAYLGYTSDKSSSPVDNSLSLGSYTLERWDSGQQVVYKKNPYYVYAASKYAIAGIHINILTAAATDTEASIKEFLAGKTDSCGIPQTYLDEYKSDPRTRQTKGDSNFKLNVNACDTETWTYLFGEDGVVTQTPAEQYWDLKVVLSNEHFVKALSYSIDRLTFASARGSVPSVNYFSSNYMSDPENGISYDATAAHEKAVQPLLDDTDGYGYSLELARDYFRLALTELEAEGKIVPGTKENPTVLNIEIAWMYATHEDNYHKEIKQFMETAFNDDSVSGGKYQLSVNFWVGDVWSDVYYNKLMVGQYDLGFGSISGNSLNPLGFMSVLSSDQTISGSFTLNWGTDTNNPEADILVYNGMRWSFDALYKASQETSIIGNGALKSAVAFDEAVATPTEAGKHVVLSFTPATGVEISVEDLVIFGYDAAQNYEEHSIFEYATIATEGGKTVITLDIPAADYAGYAAELSGYQGIDMYYSAVIAGVQGDTVYNTFSVVFVGE